MGTTDDTSTATPATTTDDGSGGGGNGPVVTSDPPADLATQIREGLTDGLRALFGGGGSGDAGTAPELGENGEPVTAPGRTRAARTDTEADVAAQTRAALDKIRADEARDERESSLAAEIEGLKEKVTTLTETPPEQYSRLNRAIWG